MSRAAWMLLAALAMALPPATLAQESADCPQAQAVEVEGFYVRAWGAGATDVWKESNGVAGLQVSPGACDGRSYAWDACMLDAFNPLRQATCLEEYRA